MNSKKFSILQFIMSIIIFLAAIAFFTKIICNFKPLYYYDIVKLNIEKDSGFNVDTIKTNYNYLINFLNESNPVKFNLPTLTSSLNGKTHFFEVHKIFKNLTYFLYFSFIFLIVSIAVTIKHKVYTYLKISGISLILLPLVLTPMLATNFTEYFDDFHKILFRNNFWLFDPDKDPVILILPEEFFMHCLIFIVISSVLLGFILLMVYIILQKNKKIYNKFYG